MCSTVQQSILINTSAYDKLVSFVPPTCILSLSAHYLNATNEVVFYVLDLESTSLTLS